ncbi:MAG: efflux RND transporter permease subunit [Rikenellaceae bacterium]
MLNIPKYSIENKKVIYLLLLIILIGGVFSFFELPKKEDSPFVIKTAVLITQHPGATPQEVETLISEPIEREIQSMSEVDKIKSESYFGVSKITIDLNPDIAPERMPAKWDELRRKVINVQPQLPAGASNITVNDDFGDVFGIYFGLTIDEGFSYNELRYWAQKIRTKLTPIDGVQKVMLYGEQTEVINVSITPSKLASLGIDPAAIRATLQGQNTQVNTGLVSTDSYQLRILTEGTYSSLEDIENQLIVSKDGRDIRLGDIATVKRGYYDPPTTLMRVNGKRAIGIGVATGAQDNVVAVGEKVDIELEQIKEIMPIGIELTSLYPEDKIANEANNGFIINLIESLLIVIVIIFLAMGYRAGLLIGSSLIFSVAGALLIMWMTGVGLNRTSLAAFIIAMGMLVDNAIVVTDNAQIGILRGKNRVQALIDGALKPQWALLGATFIAVVSFLPMYLAPSSVAEIVAPLFVVLAVSLGLSWLLAMSQTTSFGTFILKSRSAGSEVIDPYDKPLYHKFGRVLTAMIKHRYLMLASVIITLIFSLYIMGLMPQSFFPKMDKPYFRADMLYPEGYSIQAVDKDIKHLEEYLSQNPKIKTYSITMGGTPLRYYLASSSFGPKPNYSNIVIEAYNSEDVSDLEREFYYYMNENYPNTITRSALFAISPTTEAAIEIGFIGENVDTLTMLVEKAKKIALESENVTSVRSNWGEKVPLWKPIYSQQKGLRLGVTREKVSSSLSTVTSGMTIGGYREGDLTLPILLKAEDSGEWSFNDIKSVPVFSTKGEPVNVEQVIDDFEVDYDYNLVRRYNRELCMMMQCEPVRGANLMDAFTEVWSRVQSEIDIPEGYKLKYFGEQEIQDQSYSALSKNMPLMFILMYFILLLLFPKNFRKPILIMAMLPLMFIGVVWGLIIFGKSLDFFAILGILGLIGMNIKNSIVLVEEIEVQLSEGTSRVNAIIEATKSRIIPVTMASGTTILGMLPLLGDAMFAGMASTIMGGLFVSTILTIFILPVTYCIFFKIKVSKDEK